MSELEELRTRLEEAEETLRAIRSGEVDALVVSGQEGEQIFTLKGSEHPYRVFIEQMNEGAVTLAGDGTILYSNHCFADMLKMPLHKVIGRSMFDFLAEGDPQVIRSIIDGGISGNHKEEFCLLAADGTCVPVYLSFNPMTIDGAQILCMVVTNLTAQKQNEAAMAEEKRRLDEEQLKANKLESIGILAGGLAHDLNNSLAAVLGNISFAKRSVRPEDQLHKKLSEAEMACLQARDVTQQLLTFSKGGAPIKKVSSMAPLIRDWVGFALSGSNVQRQFCIPDNLWTVEIDEGQISRVINNLVINAEQAMPEGGTITVTAENFDAGPAGGNGHLPLESGRYIKITIQDRGTGIPPAHLSKIFDPYFTTKQKGSGLGLSIAYSVIKNHDGYITAESELGVGTTFYIYLPASEQKIEAQEQVEDSPQVGNLRVLVMDDQEAIGEMIKQVLTELEEHEVEHVVDGMEAIQLYKQAMEQERPYDVVMMDLTIPGGMGGREAIGRLLEVDPDARVIVFSGYSNDPIMSQFREHGFSGVIRKPFQINELLEVLHKAVGYTNAK